MARRLTADGEGYAVDPNATALREGEVLRVPVVKEELKVEKVPRVTEEVVVRAVPETEQVERDVQPLFPRSSYRVPPTVS